MDLGIRGRVAIVTGGSRGLGYFSALALAREGVNVAVCARGEERLRQSVEELRGQGVRALGVVADITDSTAAERLHQQVVEELGPVDILVNNVGGGAGRDILTITDEEMSQALELNLLGALRLIRLVLPHMREQRWGRIISISSVFGREWGGRLAYMTAKTALISATKHMALQLASEGVLVNSVAPGSIAFPGGSWGRFIQEQPKEVVDDFIRRNLPMGRFGWPEPVADTVAFLASERASLITGACINVDGGQSRSLI